MSCCITKEENKLYKHRLAAKTDANEQAIVKELRQIPGITVEQGHDDILVGYKGQNWWYELKSPDCVSRKTGTVLDSSKKPSQIRLEQEWKGKYRVVWNINQILIDLGIPAY